MSHSRSLFGMLVGLTLCVCVWHISTQEAQLIASQYANDPPDYADASEALATSNTISPHTNSTNVANNSTTPPTSAAAAVDDQLPPLADMPNDMSQLIDLTDFAYLIEQPPCDATANDRRRHRIVTNNQSAAAGSSSSSSADSAPAPPMLIMVHSAPGNWAKRNMIRETWGRDDTGRTRVLFLLGAVPTPQAQHKLAKENYLYADLLQGNFMDAYRNMTYKHAMALKWFAYNCPNQPYLLKTDDDVFLNTPNALRYLAAASTPRRNLILCSRKHRSRISRSYRSKWRVGMQEFTGYYFPDYCPGYYILYSADVVQRLYRQAQRTPYFWIDDVHMTGTLAIGANVTITPFEGDLYLSEQQQERWVQSGGAIAAQDASTFANFVFTFPNPKPERIQYLWRVFGEGRAMGGSAGNSSAGNSIGQSTAQPEVQYVSSPSIS